MGYRFYFYSVPKKLVSKIKECKTNDDYIGLCERNGIKAEDWDDEKWVSPWNLGKEVYEFGKEIDFYDAVEICEDLFSSKELKDQYADYGVKICTQKTFEAAIESYASRIKGIYEDLLREKSEYPWNDLPQIDRLKKHAEDYLHWWSNPFSAPYNMDLNNPRVCNSWLYEHSIFELVRLYKTFDWGNNELIFMGW